jgi:hypothetical protein
MKKVLLVLSIVLIQYINVNAQPYNVDIIIAVEGCQTNGLGPIPIFSEGGVEGKEFLIPARTLPPELAQFQEFYDLFVGGIVGLEQGTLNENVTIMLILRLGECQAANPNVVELIVLTAQVIGDKTGPHDPFSYYFFNDGKKAFIKLNIVKFSEFLQKEGVTIDDLKAWFYAQGFPTDLDPLGISFGSDAQWFYIYLSHFSQFALGVIKNTTDINGPIELPTEFKLEQNFPNPFNPSTQISFALPNYGYTKLTIYNSLGVEVKTLISEMKSAGNHSVSFNADGLSSGMYFYELSSGEFKSTKKMMLVK